MLLRQAGKKKETTQLDRLFDECPKVIEFIVTMTEYYKNKVVYQINSEKIFSEIKTNLKRLEKIKANPIIRKEKPVDRKRVIEQYLNENGILSYFSGFEYITEAIIIILEEPQLFKKNNIEDIYVEVSKRHKTPITKISPAIEYAIRNVISDKEPNITTKSFINKIVSRYYEDYLY